MELSFSLWFYSLPVLGLLRLVGRSGQTAPFSYFSMGLPCAQCSALHMWRAVYTWQSSVISAWYLVGWSRAILEQFLYFCFHVWVEVILNSKPTCATSTGSTTEQAWKFEAFRFCPWVRIQHKAMAAAHSCLRNCLAWQRSWVSTLDGNTGQGTGTGLAEAELTEGLHKAPTGLTMEKLGPAGEGGWIKILVSLSLGVTLCQCPTVGGCWAPQLCLVHSLGGTGWSFSPAKTQNWYFRHFYKILLTAEMFFCSGEVGFFFFSFSDRNLFLVQEENKGENDFYYTITWWNWKHEILHLIWE